MVERLLCALLGHKYVVARVFNPGARQVGCTRCNRKWAMHDETKSFVDWDGELEKMYRSFGQWETRISENLPEVAAGSIRRVTPLYIAPTPRKPLTDEESAKIASTPAAVVGSYVHTFARAIERAHGITGETK